MKTILLTGFEPFLDFPINPSEQVVRSLDGEKIGDYIVVGRILPVQFDQAGAQLLKYYESIQPNAVISLGLAAGRTRISLERVAINCIDGEADNNGVRYQDVPIRMDRPVAYFSTLPIRKIVNALQSASIPAEISNTAGLYLCNYVMYTMLDYIHQHNQSIFAGFIHLPATHQLAIQYKRAIPSWELESLVQAIRICITCLSEQNVEEGWQL